MGQRGHGRGLPQPGQLTIGLSQQQQHEFQIKPKGCKCRAGNVQSHPCDVTLGFMTSFVICPIAIA